MDNKNKQNIFDNTLTKCFWTGLTKLLDIQEKAGSKYDLQVNLDVQKTLVSINQYPETNN